MLSKQEDFINAVEEVVKKFPKHKNIRTSVDFEKIKSERPPVDFDMKEFIAEANELEWNQSIEELLSDLD